LSHFIPTHHGYRHETHTHLADNTLVECLRLADIVSRGRYVRTLVDGKEIQLDLFYDYRTNIPLYPLWQAYFRKYKPPMQIVWGKNDEIFLADGAEPYKRDIPNAEIHMFDTGHFALESNGPEIAALIREFLGRTVK
jgi:pimeloyl-ACP methyl ester carboxylesterase